METSSILLPASGLAGGLILGYVARRNFFCTLSSLEQHWYGANSDGVRTWALAALVAVVLTQFSLFIGILDVSGSFYLNPLFGWLGAIVGGLAFGFGMALVGTCGYGALVRLGGGSLKSLVAILVLALAALSTQRGLLGLTRIEFFDQFHIAFTAAQSQSIPAIATAWFGQTPALAISIALMVLAAFWIFKDTAFRRNGKALLTGIIVGTVITAGWFVTSNLAGQSFEIIQVESASFVAPVSDTLMQLIGLSSTLPDYGVGMVIGTIMGSAIAAKSADDVRWEACDDARELSRHIMGAALMGFGGILALGCTIGQGVSAASLMAISAPISLAAILLGARLGLGWLLEGSMLSPFRGS